MSAVSRRLAVAIAALALWGGGAASRDLCPFPHLRQAAAATITVGPYWVDLRTGLTAFWRLTDGGGSTAADSGGAGLHATLTNGAAFGVGYAGFDGADDYLSLPAGASVAGATAVSLCLWVWPTEWAPNPGNNILFRETTSTAVVRMDVRTAATGAIQVAGRTAAADPSGTTATWLAGPPMAPTLNTWHSVCFGLDTAGGDLWWDGTHVASAPTPATFSGFGTSASTTRGVMGYATAGYLTSSGGRLANVRLWRGRRIDARVVSAVQQEDRPR